MRVSVLGITALALTACHNTPPIEPPVNTQVTQNLDVTGDGKPETITLFIKAANVHAPVQWLLTIESNGNTIFDRDGDDTDIDPQFNDREAMPGCPDYLQCKQKYYFEYMMGSLVDHNWDPDDLLDMQRGGKLSSRVYQSLQRCCSINGPKADAIVADFERRIKERKAIILNPPVSPTESGPLMMYSAEAGQFVEIDAE
jgi:hypothetical protein